MSAPRPREIAATVAGSLAAAAGTWFLTVAIGRLAGVAQLGLFAWATAIAVPWFVLAGCQLRSVITGLPPDDRSFRALFRLRLGTVLLVVVAVFAVVTVTAPLALLPLAAGVLVWNAATWIGDLAQGWLQVRDRPLAAAAVQGGRALLAAAAGVSLLLYAPGVGALGVVLAAAVASVVVLLCGEMPLVRGLPPIASPATLERGDRQWLMAVVPLGIATGAGALTINLPRYALMHWYGEAVLGGFAALGVLVTAAAQVFGAPAPLVIAHLARSFAAGDLVAVRRTLTTVTALALLLGLAGVLGALLVGRPVLTLIFGAEVADHAVALPEMALVAVVELVQFPVGYALTAAGRYRQQMPPAIIGVVVTALLLVLLVPAYGQRGAAWALVGGGIVRVIARSLPLWPLLRDRPLAKSTTDPS